MQLEAEELTGVAPAPAQSLATGGPGQFCGGIGALACQPGLTCDYSANLTCLPDAAGVCADKTRVACPLGNQPVCGCNGVTYATDCLRRRAGAALLRTGPCTSVSSGQDVGQTCGGIGALACKTGLRCDYSANRVCYADMAGVCAQPTTVFCPATYQPVCGCNGVNYRNDCQRRAAGVALAHTGRC